MIGVLGVVIACGDDSRADVATTAGITSITHSGGSTPPTSESGEGASGGATGAANSSGGTTSTGSTGSNDAAGSTDASTDAADTGAVRLDLAMVPDLGEGTCMGNGTIFSYIWIANSCEGTLTKLNTVTMEEEGRYRVREAPDGLPSRTSVNLRGDVAVANRHGGIAKVYTRLADCSESNGIPGIQTSTGKPDVLAWGDDECVAWYTETSPSHNAQRPMAWTSGVFNKDTCQYENMKLWTTGATMYLEGSMVAYRLNGDTGQIEDNVPLPTVTVGGTGSYGGAVDSHNDFWFIQNQTAPYQLGHIDAETLYVDLIEVPEPVAPYGITVDTNDRVWLAGYIGASARYDPVAHTFAVIPVTGLGLQQDAKDRMWIAHYPWDTIRGVHAIDIDTLAEVMFIDMTSATPNSRGISVDFNGYVWMVDQTNSAFRIDPDTQTWDVYAGLDCPYTYSDMTGWGLSNVTPTPG